jgi:hypothetical protein
VRCPRASRLAGLAGATRVRVRLRGPDYAVISSGMVAPSAPTPPTRTTRPDQPAPRHRRSWPHHRQPRRHVYQHPPRIVTRPRLAQYRQRPGKLRGQRGPIREVSEQPRTGMRHHALAVRGCGDPGTRRCSLHLESAPLPGGLRLQQSQFPLVAGHFRLPGPRHAGLLMKSRG